MKTSDLGLAAYLKASGVALTGAEREGKRVFFLFEDAANLMELQIGWLNGTGMIPAKAYNDCIRALKDLVHITP